MVRDTKHIRLSHRDRIPFRFRLAIRVDGTRDNETSAPMFHMIVELFGNLRNLSLVDLVRTPTDQFCYVLGGPGTIHSNPVLFRPLPGYTI